MHVSLPYEPGRAVYASPARTADDLAALAGGDVVELPAGVGEFLPPALAHLERHLFDGRAVAQPARRRRSGSSRGPGARGTLELVAEEVLELVRAGVPPEEIAIVCPSVEGLRLALEAAFGSLGVPLALESRVALRTTPFGHALLALLRFGWLDGERPELYAHLRSPYSGLPRRDVDWVEGRLRGRGVMRGDRTVAVTVELRESRPLPLLDLVGSETSPLDAVRSLADAMLRNAHGTTSPPLDERSRLDLQAHDAVGRTLDELEAIGASGVALGRADLLAALERATVRRERPGAPGRVAVLDLMRARNAALRHGLRARARAGGAPAPRPDGAVPRRRDAAHARRAPRRAPGAARRREPRPLPLRDRLLPAAPPARARPPGGGRRGLAARAEPVLGGACGSSSTRTTSAMRTVRRPLSALTRELEAAPTERERLRALATLGGRRPSEATALARENGWEQAARTCDDGVRSPDAADPRARAAPRRGSRVVLGLGPRAHGVVLGRVVRRAVPAARARSTRRSTA